MSTELITRAQEIVESIEIPERHSFFQIEKFMIGSQPTGQSQLWQITKEIKSRMESVEEFMRQIEDAEDTVEELDIKIQLKELEQPYAVDQRAEELDKRLHQIEVRKLTRLRNSTSKSIEKIRTKVKYILEEVSCLVAGFDKLTARIGPMKSWDDPHSQREMWNEKFLEEFNLRVILKRPLDTEFVKSVLALDDDAPVKKHIVSLIDGIQKQMIADKDRAVKTQQMITEQIKKPQVQPTAKHQR